MPDDVVTLVGTYGKDGDTPSLGLGAWAHHGPKFIWACDLAPMVDGVELTPFTRAAMAGDMASSLTHFGADGLPFINADYTLTLSRLPDGPYIGLAVQTHSAADGIATGSTALFDHLGQIGIGLSTAIASTGFDPAGRR